MFSIIGSLLSWVLSRFFGKAGGPTATEVAASNATAQAELNQQEAANAIISKGAATAADANARVVRDITEHKGDSTDAGANAALKRDFPDDFRD